MTKIRQQYKEYVAALFKLAGDNDDKAEAEADSVLAIETSLAKGSMPRVDLRDPNKRYHLLPVSELNTLAPDFDWATTFPASPAPTIHELNIGTPDFFKAMNEVLDYQSLDSIKSYLRFHALNYGRTLAFRSFLDLNFGFFRRRCRDRPSRTPAGSAARPSPTALWAKQSDRIG